MTGGRTESEKNFELPDPGKTLLVVGAAHSSKVKVDFEDLDTYIFLLDADEVLHFGYAFTFEPGPYSPELRADIRGLEAAGYISVGSPITLRESGQTWVNQTMEKHPDVKGILDNVSRHLVWLSRLAPEERFGIAYVKAVQL